MPERVSLIARLQGESVEAISKRLGKAPRTVRRLLSWARDALEARLLAPPRPPPRPITIDAAATPLRYEDYVLEQLIGTGGMGKVYRARHSPSGEAVAQCSLSGHLTTSSPTPRHGSDCGGSGGVARAPRPPAERRPA